MKRYYGLRYSDGNTRAFVEDGGQRWELDPRNDLRNHSPTGVEWGYAGSGPAQLALGLLMDVLKRWDEVLPVYQDFKFQVVAAFGRDPQWGVGQDGFMMEKGDMPALREWEITEEQIRQWLENRR